MKRDFFRFHLRPDHLEPPRCGPIGFQQSQQVQSLPQRPTHHREESRETKPLTLPIPGAAASKIGGKACLNAYCATSAKPRTGGATATFGCPIGPGNVATGMPRSASSPDSGCGRIQNRGSVRGLTLDGAARGLAEMAIIRLGSVAHRMVETPHARWIISCGMRLRICLRTTT